MISLARCHRLSPVIQKVGKAIHWMNHYLVDKPIGFIGTYLLDSDLSGG